MSPSVPFEGTRLACKIVKVMQEVDHIEKLGTHDTEGWAYQRASDVIRTIRRKLVEHNIALISDEVECVEADFQSAGEGLVHTARVRTIYTLIDGDSGDSRSFSMYASASDAGDKAISQAKTFSLKYALKQTFLIPDEPERAPEGQPIQPAAVATNRKALDAVKVRSAEDGIVTMKLIAVKEKISTNQSRPYLDLTYCLTSKLGQRKYASCWVDPLKPLFVGAAGSIFVVKLEPTMKSGKVYSNVVNVFKKNEVSVTLKDCKVTFGELGITDKDVPGAV